MKIQKRNGKFEEVSFDKIIRRLKNLCNDTQLGKLKLDTSLVAQRVISSIYDGVTSSELDEEAARIAVNMTDNPDFQILASRIIISNMHKSTPVTFTEAMLHLYDNVDANGNPAPILSEEFIKIVRENSEYFDTLIQTHRDYIFTYFGYKTLEKSYLQRRDNKIVERPQYMYLRVALAIHKTDFENVKRTYELISQHYYTHASPTIFNSGLPQGNLSSCFLLNGATDSLDGIYKTISDCARISKLGGGIGVHISGIRAKNSRIRGTNGKSDGIVPMLKVYNETACYVNQGSRRKGSFAIYIEVFHADIFEFLELRKNQGHENVRARDLFYAIWMCDLFMRQVENNGPWYLMCPDECPGLPDVYGEEFDKLYWKYVDAGKYRKEIRAQELWTRILEAQIETGVPYISYKDNVNKKSNQKNYGTIRSSNLCVSPDTTVLTDRGHVKIKKLKNKKVDVWNGHEWSTVIVHQTGKDQPMVKVKFNNGTHLDCTPYHKFYIETGTKPNNWSEKSVTKEVDAKDLVKGMRMVKCKFPVINPEKDASDSDSDSEPEMKLSKNKVPLKASYKTKMDYLNKFGKVHNNELHIEHSKFKVLLKIRNMIQTMGCDCLLSDNKVIIQGHNTKTLCEKEIEHTISGNTKKTTEWVQIESVTPIANSDTYCFTEPLRHAGVFNGHLTGQCNEICIYSDEKEYGTCNLCSIALPKYVRDDGTFDHELLAEVAETTVLAMNRVIDNNYYPTPETELSNKKHRPLGIGIQGLADVYMMMRLPYESEEAGKVNREIFETLYYGTMKGSIELAKRDGAYETFKGSPMSEGKFQFDLVREFDNRDPQLSGRWDWDELRGDLLKYGARNCYLTALMPTASTAQIMNNSETFEPIDSCIFKRRVLAGEFIIVNKFLVKDLQKLGLWGAEMRDRIIANDGSIQDIPEIPSDLKALYKNVWEMSMKAVINQARDRGAFVDQMQSMNLFMSNPNYKKMSSMHMYAWKQNLKSGCYYLRSKAVASAAKFSVNVETEQKMRTISQQVTQGLYDTNTTEDPEECLACGS